MSMSGPPPAISRLVNQLPSAGMPARRSQIARAWYGRPIWPASIGGLEGLDVAAAAVVERDLEHAARAVRGIHHRLRLGRGARDRLLAEHVDARVQRADRDRGVQEGRDGDADDVEVAVGDEVLPVAVEPGDAVLLAEVGARAVLHAGDGDELDAGEGVVRVHVLLAGPAEADDAGAEGRRPRVVHWFVLTTVLSVDGLESIRWSSDAVLGNHASCQRKSERGGARARDRARAGSP